MLCTPREHAHVAARHLHLLDALDALERRDVIRLRQQPQVDDLGGVGQGEELGSK